MTQTMTQPPEQMQQNQPQYKITKADKKRLQDIANAWEAYDDELNPPLQKLPDGTDPNVMTNRCAPIVEMGVDFLFGEEIGITAAKGSPPEAQKLLDDTWGRKERRLPLLQEYATNGALAGHAFMRIMPEPDDTYRLIVLDPATVFVQTKPGDCKTVLLYCIQYSIDDEEKGTSSATFYREEISRIDPDNDGDDGNPMADVDAMWNIQHWTRVGDRGAWAPVGKPYAWKYPFPPIFHNQNLVRANDLWGRGDVTKGIIGVNKALNLMESDVNLTQLLYSHPILFASGIGQKDIDTSPGRIIGVAEGADIKSVALATDIPSALKHIDDLRTSQDEMSNVPGVATGRITTTMSHGALSGVAIELLFMSILKKTKKKRCLYGDTVINVSKALFVLAGLSEKIDVEISWQYPLPSDDLPSLQAAVLKQQLGISNATLQRELGYDPDEELERKREEDAQKIADAARGQAILQQNVMAGTPQTPGMQREMPGQPMQGQGQQQ